MVRLPCWCGFIAASLFSASCGHKAATEISEVSRVELRDVWEMYSAYAEKAAKPPTKADDLKVQARGSPLGGRVLRDPNIVIVYGTAVGGTNILAYHKDVPTQGGLVLLSDGTIKTMSADDFRAAKGGN